jgi:hypothetical protein
MNALTTIVTDSMLTPHDLIKQGREAGEKEQRVQSEVVAVLRNGCYRWLWFARDVGAGHDAG